MCCSTRIGTPVGYGHWTINAYVRPRVRVSCFWWRQKVVRLNLVCDREDDFNNMK